MPRGRTRMDTKVSALVNHVSFIPNLAQTGDRRPLQKGERQRIFSTVGEHSVLPFLYLFAVSDTVLLHIRLSPRRGRHDSAAQFFCALCRKAPANLSIRYNLSS